MPYASTAELPAPVKAKLKGKKLRQWMHVFNSAYAAHQSESIAAASAWATVKKADGFVAKPLGKATEMSDFQFFMPIAKVDKQSDGTCIVAGYASTPTKDGDGEIVTLDAIKKALPGYMEWGNIREMHQLKAVGKAQEANIDTVGLWLQAKIVDPVAVQKCTDRVYQGFSIGGRKIAKTGNKITEIDMTEISVVDRPANPDCKMSLAKSAKSLGEAEGYLVKFKQKASPEGKALAKMAKIVGDLAKAGPPAAHDGLSLPAPTQKAEETKELCKTHGVADCDKCAASKAAGEIPCEAHGKFGCAACKTAKAEDDKKPTAEPDAKAKKKKDKVAKRLAKAKLAVALGAPPADFLSLRKSKSSSGSAKEAAPVFENDSFLDLKKGMNSVGSLSYCFDTIRSAQRSLMMEGKREGGDKKDQKLANDLGQVAKQLAGVIGQKVEHEGNEALDMTDADDQYVNTFLGEDGMAKVMNNVGGTGDPLTDAVAALMKRAAQPTRMQRMAMAKVDIDKSRKAAKAARKAVEDVHKMLKASYIAKAAKTPKKDDEDEDKFDHADAMGKLQKAYQEIDKARTMAKAASTQIEKAAGRSGQRGQEAGDPESGFFEVPPGVTDLTPAAMAGAAPGSKEGGGQPPMYPGDGSVYAGKTAGVDDLRKYAKNGQIPAEMVELIMKNAKNEGELEALRRIPAAAAGGRRPHSFDMSKVLGGPGGSAADITQLNKALFDGVDAAALASNDEQVHNGASAKVIGNFLTSGHFGKSILDASFRGAAGSAR